MAELDVFGRRQLVERVSLSRVRGEKNICKPGVTKQTIALSCVGKGKKVAIGVRRECVDQELDELEQQDISGDERPEMWVLRIAEIGRAHLNSSHTT